MDLAHALKVALETGKVKVGLTETLVAARSNKARLVIVARTCPDAASRQPRSRAALPSD